MKKNKIYIVVILLALLNINTSCSDFLEEDTTGKVFSNVLETQTGLESALVGAYRGWANCWSYGFNNGWATEMTLGGDDLTCPPGTGNTQEYDRYDVKNSNSSSAPVYYGCWKAIQGANNIIEHYEDCVGDDNEITIIAGEAYFIRAASYYWLVRCYGKLPLVTSADFNIENLDMELSSIQDIYTLIEGDFNKAYDMLGDERRNDEAGRPNKGAAKAMLAEVYLSEAGWPLKLDGMYEKAATAAKEVLDNRVKWGFDFEDSYAVLYENDETNSGINKEDIFTIPCNSDNGNTINAMYGYWAYPGELGGWDVVFSELTFFNNFPEGARKDATFGYTYTSQAGVTYTWEELKYKRPYYSKLMKNPNVDNYYSYKSSIPMRMLRFSQTALTYAEAKARSSAPDDLAYECINTIRTRAGLSTYSGLSNTEFIENCVNERAWELCGERVRWFDMVRLEIVQDVIDQKDSSDNQPLHTITEDDYLFPIPEHDVLLNSKLGDE